jgi:hypothetical protein
MSTQSPEAPPELLEQIRHAIHHGNQADHCRLCGEIVTDPNALRFPEPLCTRCYHNPDDTGRCSYCRAYGVVHELTPGSYHCDECFQRELDSLDNTNPESNGGALW